MIKASDVTKNIAPFMKQHGFRKQGNIFRIFDGTSTIEILFYNKGSVFDADWKTEIGRDINFDADVHIFSIENKLGLTSIPFKNTFSGLGDGWTSAFRNPHTGERHPKGVTEPQWVIATIEDFEATKAPILAALNAMIEKAKWFAVPANFAEHVYHCKAGTPGYIRNVGIQVELVAMYIAFEIDLPFKRDLYQHVYDEGERFYEIQRNSARSIYEWFDKRMKADFGRATDGLRPLLDSVS